MRYLNIKSFYARKADIPVAWSVWHCFVVHTVIVFAAAKMAGASMALDPGGFVNVLLPKTYAIVEKFIKWDAHWYTYIAQNGYDSLSIVFFPMLILLIKLTAPCFHLDYALAGFVVCNVFSFFCFYLMYTLFQLDFSSAVATRALTAFAVMPTSIYLNSVYTEPVFLTFALACVYYTRTGKWWRAGLFGALAALTRNIGVFLVCLMLFEFWEQSKKEVSRPARHAIWALTLPPLALSGFILYNYWLLGDPLAFVHAQKAWGREFSLPWVNIEHGIRQIMHHANVAGVLDFLLTAFGIAGLGTMTFIHDQKVPGSYLILGWIWLLIPLTSSSLWLPLYSMSRFVLVIFPLYLFVARLRTPYFRIFITCCTIGMALCSILFTNWHWLS